MGGIKNGKNMTNHRLTDRLTHWWGVWERMQTEHVHGYRAYQSVMDRLDEWAERLRYDGFRGNRKDHRRVQGEDR